jgi:uncharacterized protein (DUF2164 family)
MFFMKKEKPPEKPVQLTPEQRRHKIQQMLQELSAYERGLSAFDDNKDDAKVKIEFTTGSYNYHYFEMGMAAAALKGLFYVRIAEIKESLLSLGVTP